MDELTTIGLDLAKHRRNSRPVTEGAKRVDAHTVHIPGVGRVLVRESPQENIKLRSCTIVERTTQDRARRCGRHRKGRDRAFEVHVQMRGRIGRSVSMVGDVGRDASGHGEQGCRGGRGTWSSIPEAGLNSVSILEKRKNASAAALVISRT